MIRQGASGQPSNPVLHITLIHLGTTLLDRSRMRDGKVSQDKILRVKMAVKETQNQNNNNTLTSTISPRRIAETLKNLSGRDQANGQANHRTKKNGNKGNLKKWNGRLRSASEDTNNTKKDTSKETTIKGSTVHNSARMRGRTR